MFLWETLSVIIQVSYFKMTKNADGVGQRFFKMSPGTNLTNDLGYTPLQIVLKMVRCNGQPVAKLSDTPAKTMCDDASYLTYLKQVFEIEP